MVQKILNKFIGAKYITIIRNCEAKIIMSSINVLTAAGQWVPNLATWGFVGGVALIHFTDWKLVLGYVPYIKGKFTKDE